MQTLSKKLRDQTNQIIGKARMYKQERKCKYEENEELRKTKGGNGEKKVFYEGRCEHG